LVSCWRRRRGLFNPVDETGRRDLLTYCNQRADRYRQVRLKRRTFSGLANSTILPSWRFSGNRRAMKISIDIAIGVKAVQQQPLIWHASNKDAKSDVVLVLQRPGVGSQWRLSYPILERNMLLSVDASVSRVYQLLKFLAALHHSKDNLKREIPRKNPVWPHMFSRLVYSVTCTIITDLMKILGWEKTLSVTLLAFWVNSR